jgi:hypothetical protein
MSAALPVHNLASLAGRLTDTKDRETYAALMSYLNSLPPGDELVRMAELFGLLSVLGQRVPAALAEAMTELRELTTATGDYHAKVDDRLAKLPGEITEGVNVDKIIKDVSEAFRQQIIAAGLKDTTAALQKSCGDIHALSDHISARLAPLGEDYSKIAETIAADLNKLTLASRSIQAHNVQLLRDQEGNSRVWHCVLLVVMFVMGGLCGVVFEKNQTADVLANVNAQMERLQTPAVPAAAPPLPKSKKPKGSVIGVIKK